MDRRGRVSKNGRQCQEEEDDAGADINSIIPSVCREGLHYQGQDPPLAQWCWRTPIHEAEEQHLPCGSKETLIPKPLEDAAAN